MKRDPEVTEVIEYTQLKKMLMREQNSNAPGAPGWPNVKVFSHDCYKRKFRFNFIDNLEVPNIIGYIINIEYPIFDFVS